MAQIIKRNETMIRMRNYGRIIQDMVATASKETNVQRQNDMVIYIAQLMRQKNATWNKEQESGIERLKSDIQVLSHGALTCDFPEFDSLMKMISLKPVVAAEIPTGNMKRKKK